MRRFAPLLTAAFLAVACDRPAATPPAAPVPTWGLEDAGSILGAAPWEPFAKVYGVAVHLDGRTAVVDMGRKTVTLFAPEGHWLAQVGKNGRGKGEYQEPYSATWISDTLAVLDALAGRIIFFTNGTTSNGEIVTVPVTGDAVIRWYPVSPTKSYLRSVRRDGAKWLSAFVAFETRTPGDTVIIPESPKVPTGAWCGPPGALTTFFAWPEAPTPIAVPARSDGALALAISDKYRVTIRGANGDSLATISGNAAPTPLKPELWDDGQKEYLKFRARHEEAVCDGEPVKPSNRAPIRAIAVASDGDIWVTVLEGSSLRFDVYGADGKQKATVEAPSHNTTVPVVITGDRVALVATGANNAEVVRRFRLVR